MVLWAGVGWVRARGRLETPALARFHWFPQALLRIGATPSRPCSPQQWPRDEAQPVSAPAQWLEGGSASLRPVGSPAQAQSWGLGGKGVLTIGGPDSARRGSQKHRGFLQPLWGSLWAIQGPSGEETTQLFLSAMGVSGVHPSLSPPHEPCTGPAVSTYSEQLPPHWQEN